MFHPLSQDAEDRPLESPSAIRPAAACPVWQKPIWFGISYFACAQASMWFNASGSPNASFWLPSGLFVAVLLLNEYKTWPWLVLAATISNIPFDILQGTPGILIPLFILANTVEAVLSAWLVRKFVGQRPSMGTLRGFLGLLAFAGIVGTLLGAAISATGEVLLGKSQSFTSSFVNWWGSTAMATLLVSPCILAWSSPPPTERETIARPKRLLEAAALLAGIIVATWWILVLGKGINSPNKSSFAVFVIWAGLRFGVRGSTAANLLLGLGIGYCTQHFLKGLTPADLASRDYVLTMQALLLVMATLGLIPAIVLAEHDKTLEDLRKSEERFQLAVCGSTDGIWDWNILSNAVFYSERYRSLLGYTRAEFPDAFVSFVSVLHADDLDRVLGSIETSLKQRTPHDIEFRLRTKPGEFRWFRGRGEAIWNAQGKPVRMAGSITDITEQKMAALSLLQSEQRFSRIFNNSPVPIVLFRLADGVVLDANECFFRMSGFTREEVIGHTALELKVYPDPSRRAFIMDQLRQHGHLHGYEQLFRAKSGQILSHVLWLDVVSINAEDCVLVIALDLTADKLREQLIRESEEKFSKAFLSSPNGVAISELETGRYIEVNDSFCQMLGRGRDEILGRTSIELGAFQTVAEREKALGSLRSTGHVRDCELRIRTPCGVAKTVLVSAERIELGGMPCLVLVVFEITARLEAETRLEKTGRQLRALTSRLQSLREEERTHLAREIHDHLGQLLTALSLDLATIERRAAHVSDPALLAPLNAKISSARALTVETISAVQKIASGLRPPILDRVGLEAAIEAEVQSFQLRSGMRCQLRVPDRTTKLTPDQATAMFRIFQEILTNVSRHARASILTVALRREHGTLQLVVADDGVGIQESDLEDPSSIGLLGMRERAQILGGNITFGRNAGQGTIVTVNIPLAEEKSKLT
jgi:PAS domain S-box-containing protein